MEFGNLLPCYSGIDRFSVLTKSEKWLAEYRHYKIKYLQNGLFLNKDYSIPLSQIPEKEIKRLKEIQKRIPLVGFTSTRVQFFNELKVLKFLLSNTKISYRKRRDIHSVCQKYTINFNSSNFDYSASSLKNLIWWSIAQFTFDGTGQEKIASRLYRNRVFINQKIKACPYVQVINRYIEIERFQASSQKNDHASQRNKATLSALKNNSSELSRGLLLKKCKDHSGKNYVALIKVLPNKYTTSEKLKDSITIDPRKTFHFTKKSSNRLHFKNLNERSKRVHAKVAFKAFNEIEDFRKKKKIQKRSWKSARSKFLKRIIVGSGTEPQETDYVIRPNNSLNRNLRLIRPKKNVNKWMIYEIAS